MDNSTATPFNSKAIPVRWGLILGLLSCVFTTIEFKVFSDKYIVFMLSWLVVVAVGITIYCVAAVQQRRAMGGYITFKEAFQAIFIVIVIYTIINSVYGFLYFNYIDPTAMDRMMQSTVDFMERVNAPQESIDDAIAGFEKSAKDVKGIGGAAMGLCKAIIINSIIGFICAAIIKKKKPEFAAQ